jgi:hypothetical protein
MRRSERAWASVPPGLWALLGLLLTAQVLLRASAPAPTALASELPQPPATPYLRVAALDDPPTLAYAMSLRLQTFDNQPGVSLPFASLDYARVEAWLDAMLTLDPASQYPMLMAAHLYAQVLGHPDKQREMAEFVYRKFLESPRRRWPWLAHVAIMAKHRLKDPRLAIRYADAIRDHANAPEVPSWARQMHIFLREDVGELESARALLGGLLDSGTVTDPQEFRFLMERLKVMDAENPTSSPKTRR